MSNSATRATVERMRQDAQRATATIRTGLVVSAGWVSGGPSTVINVDGREFINLPMAGELNLIPGQTVSVMRTGAQLVVIGPGSADTMPLQGTVSATGASTCQVQLSYSTGTRTVNAPWLTHYSPTIGDLVKLEWAYGTPVVVGKLSAALPNALTPPFVPVPPIGAPTSGVATFTAVDSATLNYLVSGLEVGYSPGRSLHILRIAAQFARTAMWFYGDTIKASSAGRVANGAPSIFIDLNRAPIHTVVALQDRSSRALPHPGYPPGFGSVLIKPRTQSGWVDLPEAWAPALMSNEWGVVCFAASDGGIDMDGIDTNSQSGALRIPWKNA